MRSPTGSTSGTAGGRSAPTRRARPRPWWARRCTMPSSATCWRTSATRRTRWCGCWRWCRADLSRRGHPGCIFSLPMTEPRSSLVTALANRYRIERELGQGGMATVYLAEDLRHDRKVAIKVLRPELAASMGPDRFLREIEIAAQLQHPHILPLLDSGDAGGFLFYVMPYVQGESLRDRLARERELPVHDALRIV